MAKFKSELVVRLLNQQAAQGRGNWEVQKPLVYETDLRPNDIIVPVGFQTDFASVPRLPYIFLIVGDIAQEAAVIHDYLYETQILGRRDADRVLREAALVTGCKWHQAWILYIGVRIGGWYGWNKFASNK
jgi:hypothetical protein